MCVVKKIILIFLSVFFIGANASTAPLSTYWIGFDDYSIFTHKQIKQITSHSNVVIINPPSEEIATLPRLKRLVSRIKDRDPETKVLLAVILTRWQRSGRLNTSFMDDFFSNNIRKNDWVLPAYDYSKIFIDIRSKDYQSAAIKRLVDIRKQAGLDGFVVDLAYYLEDLPINTGYCKPTHKCEGYNEQLNELFADLKKNLGKDSYLGFNGLNYVKTLDLITPLINLTDFSVIEFFGLNPRPVGARRDKSFKNNIEIYLNKIKQFSGKQIFVFGRGSWKYVDYEEDLQWQNYLFCAYLLAKNETTTYKYHSTFQAPTIAGRSGGLDLYESNAHHLGAPAADYQKKGNVYYRSFEHGMVLISPHDGEGGQLDLDHVYYDDKGQSVTSSVMVKPGTGKMLFRNKHEVVSQPNQIIVRKIKNGPAYYYFDTNRAAKNPALLKLSKQAIAPNRQYYLEMEVNDLRRKKQKLSVSLTRIDSDQECPFMLKSKDHYIKMSFHSINCDDKFLRINGKRILTKTNRYKFKKWSALSSE